MSALSAFLLLPAALLLDRLLGEPPARIHPVCGMGALAAIMERVFRRGPNGPRMTLAGLAACLAVVKMKNTFKNSEFVISIQS